MSEALGRSAGSSSVKPQWHLHAGTEIQHLTYTYSKNRCWEFYSDLSCWWWSELATQSVRVRRPGNKNPTELLHLNLTKPCFRLNQTKQQYIQLHKSITDTYLQHGLFISRTLINAGIQLFYLLSGSLSLSRYQMRFQNFVVNNPHFGTLAQFTIFAVFLVFVVSVCISF